MVRSIGANQVIDYTKEDFTKSGQRYDLILDNVGNHSLFENRRVLTPRGKYVLIGGGGLNDGRWIGALARPITALVLSRFVTQDMGMMPVSQSRQQVMKQFEITDSQLRQIEDEGLDKEWPPLNEAVQEVG